MIAHADKACTVFEYIDNALYWDQEESGPEDSGDAVMKKVSFGGITETKHFCWIAKNWEYNVVKPSEREVLVVHYTE